MAQNVALEINVIGNHLWLCFLAAFACESKGNHGVPHESPEAARHSDSPATSRIPACGRVDGLGLSAFVGKKISLKEVPPPPDKIPFDQHYRARYSVLHRICGDVSGDVIEFDVYSHKGYPAFARSETALLYVSRYESGYVHQKYLYDSVYPAKDGSWAGCGDPYMYATTPPRGTVKTTEVELKEPISISVADLPEEYIARMFSSKYYTRHGDHVVCKTGAPAEQLYSIKRLGVLKEREP